MEQRAQIYVGSDGKSLPNRTSYSSGILKERQHTSDVPVPEQLLENKTNGLQFSRNYIFISQSRH